MSDFQVKQHQQIGSQGEFTAHFLSINEYAKIPHHQLSHPSAQSDSLKSQVEAWLGEISPGTRIDIGLHSAMDLVNLQCSYEDNNKKLDADKVQINYFERYLKKGQPTTDIITPRIYPDGGIDKWPDGFFDQAEKDLMELL
jgi:predicted ATPase